MQFFKRFILNSSVFFFRFSEYEKSCIFSKKFQDQIYFSHNFIILFWSKFCQMRNNSRRCPNINRVEKNLAWQKGVILKVGPFTISITQKKYLSFWNGMMSDFDNLKWVFSRIIFFQDRLLHHSSEIRGLCLMK